MLCLTPEMFEILTGRLRSPGSWLFPSERNSGQHITKLNNSHDRACREATRLRQEELEKRGRFEDAKDADVSFVLYDLRHAFGTYHGTVLKTDPFTLAAMMGHANLRTIMHVHPDQYRQKEAMEKYVEQLRKTKIRRVK